MYQRGKGPLQWRRVVRGGWINIAAAPASNDEDKKSKRRWSSLSFSRDRVSKGFGGLMLVLVLVCCAQYWFFVTNVFYKFTDFLSSCHPQLAGLEEIMAMTKDDAIYGDPHCDKPLRELPPSVRLPRVYIYDPAVNALATSNVCGELPFRDLMLRNVTGNIVSTLEEADRIFVPFLAQCFTENQKGFQMNFLRKSPFQRLLSELEGSVIKRAGRMADIFIYSQRHYVQRTGFGIPMRKLLKEYPFTILSPEVTNLKRSEVREGKEWLHRHIVVPQEPLITWTSKKAYEEGRKYRFCFTGTLVNDERKVLVEVMAGRDDSFVLSGCRKDRVALRGKLQLKNAAVAMYTNCDMCLIPLGDSLSDRRLFDAMSVGCVPIVTRDMRPLPFPKARGGKEKGGGNEELDYPGAQDWGRAILRAPVVTERKDADILRRRFDELAAMDAAEFARYRNASIALSEYLSFSSCSGYAGLKLALQRLLLQRQEEVRVPLDLISLTMGQGGG